METLALMFDRESETPAFQEARTRRQEGRRQKANKQNDHVFSCHAMGEERMPALPGGTVTFLFTDIEGSTRLWEEQPDTMRLALSRHDALLRAAIETNDGVVFKTIGDAFCAAFPTAPQALRAALEAQQNLHQVKAAVGDDLTLKVRMA